MEGGLCGKGLIQGCKLNHWTRSEFNGGGKSSKEEREYYPKHTQTNNNGHLSTTASLNLDKLILIPILFIKRPKSDQLCASTKGGGHYKQVWVTKVV